MSDLYPLQPRRPGALLGGSPLDELMVVSVVMVVVLLVSGLFYFRRMEKTFADVV